MKTILTTDEKFYLKCELGFTCVEENNIDKELLLKEIEERIKKVDDLLLFCRECGEYLTSVYEQEKITLCNIEKKIKEAIKENEKIEKKNEIMKNALDMYISDTSEKIIFIRDNFGNDSGMMKHFIEILDIAKGMRNEIIKG